MHQENDKILPIGIIAGKGLLPVELARISKKLNIEHVMACINGHADEAVVQNISHKFFNIGNVGSIIDYFKSNNVKNIIFAGSIQRPNLASVKVDITGALLMAKVFKQKFLGDDSLLRIISDFFENKGFKIMSARDILSLDGKSQELSSFKNLSAQNKIDIELGLNIAKTLGNLDIGQAVIIENGYVLGVEAAEGTDKLIERCAILRKKSHGGVLVKILKPNQDPRLDIPTIGADTITKLAEFKYDGLAIETENVIIIDPTSTFELANRLNIFIKKI